MPKALVNGVHLDYVDEGEGDAVVLMHAHGWSQQFWAPQVEEYSQKYRVVAASCRGHGDSEKPHTPYSIEGFADDHLELCDQLGIERAHLIGTSMGGCLAMIMALKRPQFVRSMVLIGTWASADPTFHKYHHETIALLDQPDGLEVYAKRRIPIIYSQSFIDRRPEFIASEHGRVTSLDPKAIQLTSAAFLDYDIVNDISAITAPTLVLVGGDDRLDPPHLSHEIRERIKGSTFLEIGGSGHLPSLELPERFDWIVLDWLSRHSGN